MGGPALVHEWLRPCLEYLKFIRCRFENTNLLSHPPKRARFLSKWWVEGNFLPKCVLLYALPLPTSVYYMSDLFLFFIFKERKVWQDAVDMEHKMKHLGWDKQILFEIWNPPWNERKQNIEILVGSGWMWWFSFCNVAIVLMVLGNLAIFQVKILLNRF